MCVCAMRCRPLTVAQPHAPVLGPSMGDVPRECDRIGCPSEPVLRPDGTLTASEDGPHIRPVEGGM